MLTMINLFVLEYLISKILMKINLSFIHDMDTDTYIDLRQQNYEINLPVGNYSNRFEIVFQDQSLSTDEFNNEDLVVIQNNNTSQLTILNPNQLEINGVTLFDVSGKRIFKCFQSRNTRQVSIPNQKT